MFTNLTYQDKEAFFQLLDEYFASRPNLLGGGQQHSSSSNNPSPVESLATLGRFLSPPPQSNNNNNNNGNGNGYGSSPTSPTTPKTEQEILREAKEKEQEAKRVEMVTKLAQRGIKHGTSGARSSIGLIARSGTAMGALDKYGAGGIVRGADGLVNRKKNEQQMAPGAGPAGGGEMDGKKSPPAPPQKKGGVSGLVSGKSFGHVDTSSKMSAFTSMWKDPQKVQTPAVQHYDPPALAQPRVNLPPPQRRGTGSPAQVEAQQHEDVSAESQAQAIYDYSGADPGDLSIQNGQIVNVLEKTSDDWWTCEDGNGQRGLVPANYLKEI